MANSPRNIAVTLAYDGSAYCGWQIQPDAISVQQVVHSALHKLTGEEVTVLAAGRTDSGVHARGQVINFRTQSSIPTDKFRPALQSSLPADIVVREVREVAEGFHATYSAVRKCYRYLLHLGPVAIPSLRNLVWRIDRPLDLDAMSEAARSLLGTHDFRCFESHFPNKSTSVRTVERAEFVPLPHWPGFGGYDFAAAHSTPDGDGMLWGFEIAADGFLYNMVRAIVGTLVDIGRGRFPRDYITEVIARQDRALAGATAPPQGLFLVSVDYGDWSS